MCGASTHLYADKVMCCTKPFGERVKVDRCWARGSSSGVLGSAPIDTIASSQKTGGRKSLPHRHSLTVCHVAFSLWRVRFYRKTYSSDPLFSGVRILLLHSLPKTLLCILSFGQSHPPACTDLYRSYPPISFSSAP